MEELFQLLVGSFRLPVGPRVEGCGGVLSDAKRLTHFDGETTHESGVSVMDEHFGEPYTFEHMFQVEFGNSFGCDCFVAWYEDDCFSTVMVRNCEY